MDRSGSTKAVARVSVISRDKAQYLFPVFAGEERRERMLRAYLNYGLVVAVAVWAAVVGMMAYRLEESQWRWAFVALVFAGGLTIAAIFWIRKYVNGLNKSPEEQEQKP